MRVRDFFAMAALIGFVAPGNSADARSQRKPPNVVLIVADDMAYGDLGANGAGAWVETPHLDRLAASGLRFTAGYAAAPVCGPSRIGLLTGFYPQRFGGWWNPDTGKVRIDDARLLPALLGGAGYRTAVIGKWNLPNAPERAANSTYDIMNWGGRYWPNPGGDYTGVGKGSGSEGGASGRWDDSRPGNYYLTDKLTDDAVSFLAAQNSSRPFFLYLAYNAPHSPLEAAERYRSRVAHLDSEPKRLYAAMVLALDDGVGKVAQTLARRGLDRDTVVIFVSDNGPAKGNFRGYQPNWPAEVLGARGALSGTKGTYREGGIRVPFLISWPARIAPGQVRGDAVMLPDLFITILKLARRRSPTSSAVDGIDLAPIFAGHELPSRDLFWAGRQCRKQGGCTYSGAMRRGSWKLLVEGETIQLFDLAADPAEQTDLSSRAPARLAGMLARYKQWKAGLAQPASDGIANSEAAE